MISGNMVGSYSQIGKTFILQDENGNELVGVVTDNVQVFDATDNDVREGKTYVSDTGASTGTKNIPSYNTSEGYIAITPKSKFIIKSLQTLDRYDYTKLQAIICPWAGNLAGSVAAEKVAIGDKVYAVNSTEIVATIIKDSDNKYINFAITNESDIPYLLRYFTYKEIY